MIGMDMAAAPLEVARERARKRGLDNVEYLQGDVHALPFADGSFDRVTSRLGVMFFADLAEGSGRDASGAEAGRESRAADLGPDGAAVF